MKELMESLDRVKYHIKSGDQESARRALSQVLDADPHHAEAWALLATVLDNSDRQAHCYRRVLAIDPGDREAAEKLRRLTGEQPPTGETPDAAPRPEARPLRCAQCGGVLEVRFVGRLRDKRALCQHCGTEVDLPDTYKRVERQREQKWRPWGTRTVDRTVVETRSDHPGALSDGAIPQALDELLRSVGARGGEITVHSTTIPGEETEGKTSSLEEITRWLQEQGVSISEDELLQKLQDDDSFVISGSPVKSQVLIQRTVQETRQDIRLPGLLGKVLRRLGGDDPMTEPPGNPRTSPSTPDQIVQAAGDPISPKARTKCPQCGATISKSAPRCTWCGMWFE